MNYRPGITYTIKTKSQKLFDTKIIDESYENNQIKTKVHRNVWNTPVEEWHFT